MTMLIDADKVNATIDKFIGYLDEDMILRIKMKISAIPTVERPHDKWEYLKEHITELRDADGELNQKDTCKFILNLMGVIEKEGESKWSNMKYCVCCPMCDKDKCVRGTEECDAEKWEKEKAGVVFCCVCRYRDTECCKWRSDESPDDDDFCSIGERR